MALDQLSSAVPIEGQEVLAYEIATDGPGGSCCPTSRFSVDCLQADVTGCGGITGLLQAAGLSAAPQIDLSAHCAPAVSAHAFCAVQRLRHLEYFYDHVRIESMLFDGTLSPVGEQLAPAPACPGLGLDLRASDNAHYLVHHSKHTRA